MSRPVSKKGFTLIEILIVIAIIAILAAVVIVAINPARQFAQARNSTRQSNVVAILDAVWQNVADNDGTWTCASAGDIPTSTPTVIGSGSGEYNICSCLVPTYLSEVPIDPKTGTGSCTSENVGSNPSYSTGYTVIQSTTTSRVTVAAPDAELGETITQTN